MKASFYILCTILPFLAHSSEVDDVYPVIQGNNEFNNHLYRILSLRIPGNFVYSPLTTHALLTMAYQGANGTTAQALQNALRVSTPSAIAEGYKSVFKAIQQTAGGNLIVATKIYLQYGSPLKPAFKEALTEQYGSEGNMLDFTDKEAAAKSVNEWVKEKTLDKIPEIVNANDFYDGTKMILLNAIYFRGFWDNRFNVEKTRNEPFYVNQVKKSYVPTMHVEAVVKYRDDLNLNAQVLELTYKNTPLSLLIILPKSRVGLRGVQEALARRNLADVSPSEFRLANISLPKFKIESTLNLVEPLKQLGLNEIFDETKANFSGVVEGTGNLCIGNVIQKTFLEIDENGSEAASTPSVRFHPVVAHETADQERRRVTFVADHPFLFFLVNQHKATNAILQGRVENL